ncbi:hypothetical protein CCAN11_2330029 [Capnocytophaga canimorsus]|uniref:Uncharacterized protein n=1 Tax=Capnocytophaga canimorsus TaxID=28188 RepID=A0A0B7II95_9FLAO|nr:hypothetical protein CCAN11_2330029 [Capnocytophaga canimorsus]
MKETEETNPNKTDEHSENPNAGENLKKLPRHPSLLQRL